MPTKSPNYGRTRVYPTLDSLKSGNSPNALQTDALNRVSFRSNERKQNAADNVPTAQGGMPVMPGAESRVPDILEAARQMGKPAGRIVTPQLLEKLRSMGVVPQKMAKQLGTSNPVDQMKRLLGG